MKLQKIFLLIVIFAMHNLIASTITFNCDVFNNYIVPYCFTKTKSIDGLQKNYYNFCSLSKKYYEETKKHWDENWFSIMEQVCDEQRFERLYFAGIFYHVNDDIKKYFETHLFVYKTLLYYSSNQVMVYPPTLEWLAALDPNYTMFGTNCHMSLLECCIKASYYPVKNKTELCINLIQRGAQYDIWMHHGITQKERKETIFHPIFNDVNNVNDPYGPFLLSEYIARHIRCTIELAKAIVEKGTCAQDIFINRYPELAIYRKEDIPKPTQPENFINHHHFSEIRYLELFFKGLMIPYYINEEISMFKGTKKYQDSIDYEWTVRCRNCEKILKNFEIDGKEFFHYFYSSYYYSFMAVTCPSKYHSNEKKLEKFKQQYKPHDKDAEGKNAFEYFKQFSKLKKIPINIDTLEWLTVINTKLICPLNQITQCINQKSIFIPESIIQWFAILTKTLEIPPIEKPAEDTTQIIPSKDLNNTLKIGIKTIENIKNLLSKACIHFEDVNEKKIVQETEVENKKFVKAIQSVSEVGIEKDINTVSLENVPDMDSTKPENLFVEAITIDQKEQAHSTKPIKTPNLLRDIAHKIIRFFTIKKAILSLSLIASIVFITTSFEKFKSSVKSIY